MSSFDYENLERVNSRGRIFAQAEKDRLIGAVPEHGENDGVTRRIHEKGEA